MGVGTSGMVFRRPARIGRTVSSKGAHKVVLARVLGRFDANEEINAEVNSELVSRMGAQTGSILVRRGLNEFLASDRLAKSCNKRVCLFG